MTSVLLCVEQLRRAVPGGIGTYAEHLARALAGLEAEGTLGDLGPVLYASRNSGSAGDPLAEVGLPLKISRLPGWALTRLWRAGLSWEAREHDLVHATSLATPPAYGRPLVITLHDLAWRLEPRSFTTRGRRWHEAALRVARVRASAFVVPSQETADALVEMGVDTGRVTVIPHGSDHLPPPDQEAAGRRLRELGVTGPYLLAVGTLEPRKNLARLFEAYRRARSALPEPWPLVVVGPRGWGRQARSVEGVVLAGDVPPAVLAALYSGARCSAYVPLVEGFGLPVVEAMAHGAPVVASAVPSAGAAAREVDPLDADSIAAGLLEAAEDGRRRRALIEAGRARAAELTWHASATRHVELWRGLLADRRWLGAGPRGGRSDERA